MNFLIPIPSPTVAGVTCLGLAVLVMLASRHRWRFSRLFLLFLLCESGVLLLCDAYAVPRTEVAVGGAGGGGMFPGEGGDPTEEGGAGPAPDVAADDSQLLTSPRWAASGARADLASLEGFAEGIGGQGGLGGQGEGKGEISGDAKTVGGGNFFPKHLDYHRVVFVLDASGSMQGNRWDRLVRDLGKRLHSLPEDTPFAIILFNDKPVLLKGDNSPKWNSKSTKTVEDVVGRLKAIGKEINPNDGTQPREALEMSLAMTPRPRWLLVLTDGEFNDSTTPKDRWAKDVKAQAAKSYTRIYGVFVTDAADESNGEKDLKSLITNPNNLYKAKP